MSESYTLDWGTRIPVQDGISLHGVLYRPHNYERLTTILHITPYGADAWHDRGLPYTQHGYALLLVDSRGRGNSEGAFRPFSPDDGRDGAAVVNWITEQPWSDGTVGMIGGSYTGYNQWATLVHRPPGLKSIMPRASAFPGLDAPRFRNIAPLFSLRWLSYVRGKCLNERIFSDDQLWLERYLDYLDSGRSLRDFAKSIGVVLDDTAAVRLETLTPDDAMYALLDLPILTITSQYDSQQHGALEYYRRHRSARGDAAMRSHYLIVGAWNHATQLRFGGLDLSKALRFDLVAVELAWFDWVFKNGKRPDFLDARIKVFSTGDNRWHRIRALDKTTARENFFLSGEGRLTPRAPAQSSSEVLRSDPRDHRSAQRLALKHPRRGLALTSPDHTEHLFGQGLVYESAPLRRVFTIIGAPQLQLQLESDLPDMDMQVCLFDVAPDGRKLAISEAIVRMRHRDGLNTEKLMPIGERFSLHLDERAFTYCARHIRKKHRLQLLIKPLAYACMDEDPIFEINYQAAKPVAVQTIADATPGQIVIRHSARAASYLVLPVLRS